jgi:transcriptional regulator with XRE-family HTH domain
MLLELARNFINIPRREHQEEVFALTRALAAHEDEAAVYAYVSRRVRERRIMLGLTRQQMAELIGASYTQAYNYEKGVSRVPAPRLYRIASALGVHVDYFFEGLHGYSRTFAETPQQRMLLELARNFIGISTRKQQEEVIALTQTLAAPPHAEAAEVTTNSPLNSSLAAPARFVMKLMETWALGDSEAARLLGLEDEADFRALMSGVKQLDTRDAKDRVRHLLRMREALRTLFRDIHAEREWLREPRPELDAQSPLDLLLEGSMENVLVVSQFVQWMVGR